VYFYDVSKFAVHLPLSAGLDTINASLQFAIAEVIMHSDVQEKLATEVDKVLGVYRYFFIDLLIIYL